MNRNRNARGQRGGFTLMELLLVMAILVILLGLVAPRFVGTQKKANIDAAKSQVDLFAEALDLYNTHLNAYPTTEQGLAILAANEPPEDLENKKGWAGPYIKSNKGVPKDPWGHDYQYAYPPTHNEDFPDIWSVGPDGEDGTDDDIGNWTTEEEESSKA